MRFWTPFSQSLQLPVLLWGGGVPLPWAHQSLEDKRGETGALDDAGEERGEEQGAQRNSIRCLEREPGPGEPIGKNQRVWTSV